MSDEYIAIVAHDAGAANHILAWLQSGHISQSHIRLCLDGPAKQLFNRSTIKWTNNSLDKVFFDAPILISGTGWASSLEHDAREIAQSKGLKSIAVIDHWTNYQQRFIRNDRQVLPDIVWVVDEYALSIAQQCFSHVQIILQPNDYLSQQVQEIIRLKEKQQKTEGLVLFLMEPIRQPWNDSQIPSEIQAFKYFIEHKSSLNLTADNQIIIKPHPSDPEGKYDALILKYKSLQLSIDSSSSLSSLIAGAEVIIGCQTYAMVVALAAGKRVISAIPSYAPPCVLPQKEICHLSERVH